jgi:hypothetical protein
MVWTSASVIRKKHIMHDESSIRQQGIGGFGYQVRVFLFSESMNDIGHPGRIIIRAKIKLPVAAFHDQDSIAQSVILNILTGHFQGQRQIQENANQFRISLQRQTTVGNNRKHEIASIMSHRAARMRCSISSVLINRRSLLFNEVLSTSHADGSRNVAAAKEQ